MDQDITKQSSNQLKKYISKQNSGKYKFQKREGTTGGLDGHFYEIDLLIAAKLRGDRDLNKYYLATNIDGLGAFDDVVIRYWKSNSEKEKPTTIFLQAKHLDDSKKGKITIEKFKNPKYDKFYLGKYFLDYLRIREKFNEKSADPLFLGNFQELDLKYVIYTNAVLDERFSENRKIDIDDRIVFSTKPKDGKDKAFKFSLDNNINSDLIEMLEDISYQETIKSLAKAIVRCICGELNYNNMMGNQFLLTYHVFLAKSVIDVIAEIKEDKKKIKYREGKINHNFFNIGNIDGLEKKLKEEILYEYAKNVVFSEKCSTRLEDTSDLVNKVIESLNSSKKVDENVIKKLGGSAIILDPQKRKLKFANQEKLNNKNAKKFIKDLENKVDNLADYEFDIPYELVKKALEEQIEKKPLKLHVTFGNVSHDFKKPEHLIKQFIKLFEKYKSKKIIKIDYSTIGHDKDLTEGDIKNIRKLVGNLLVFDEKKKMLKLANNESLGENALRLYEELKSAARKRELKVNNYRFDIKVKNFPRYTLFVDDEDRSNVEEFLNKLEVFTGQTSDSELQKVIKDEIKDLYKLTEKEVEENYFKIRNKAEEYWRNGDYYLEKDDDFFTNIHKFNILFDVREPVALFIGRKKELNDLYSKIQHDSEKVTAISKIVSISGLGGVGKTELARKYAYDHRNDYDGNVIWINAENYCTLVESFHRLAHDKLGIKIEKRSVKSIVEDVYEFFSKRKSLIIFENAEKSEQFKELLPLTLSYNNKPYILITSRISKEEWKQWGVQEGITLDVFTDEEALRFVKNALNVNNNSQDNEIRKLAIHVLYKFPLALGQAVAHIKEENVKSQLRGKEEYTIVKYIEDYEKGKEKLLNSEAFRSLDNDYAKTTFTTWKVTTDKIKGDKEYGQLALKILDLMAYFAPENIPVESFFLKLTEEDEEKLWNALGILFRYSMIKLDQGKADIHGLVQEVTRVNLTSKKIEEETLREALELIQSFSLKEVDKQLHPCVFYPITEDAKLSNTDRHITYVWNYASIYSQLIEDFYTAYGENGNTPINLFATNGKLEAMKSILKNIQKDKLIDKISEYNSMNYAPIHSAVFNGHKEIVEYLIKNQGVDVNFATNSTKVTPMFVAILGNQLHILRYLLCQEANPNIGPHFPIHYAAMLARKDLIECLLVNSNVDIQICDKDGGNNVLCFAVNHLNSCDEHYSDVQNIVKLLLEKDSDLVHGKNYWGLTPLHCAAESGYHNIVKMILDCGANVNVKSYKCTIVNEGKPSLLLKHVLNYDEGYTPLHIAAKKNHLGVVMILLRKGAIYSATNNENCTPLDLAEYKSDVANLLECINRLFKVIRSGKKDELNYLLEGKKIYVLKAILHARNREEKTLLEFAIVNKKKDIENLLSELNIRTSRFQIDHFD